MSSERTGDTDMTCPHRPTPETPRGAEIVRQEGAQLDFSRSMSYGDYLHLDEILGAAVHHLGSDQLQPAFKMLARVSKIMEQRVHAWDVLATMTPPEYSAIRPYLPQSSGFQSWQYRCIEFTLGNKNAAMRQPHAHRPDLLQVVETAWHAPSLYDEALHLLARRGLPVPQPATPRATGPSPTRPARRCRRPGWRSTATPSSTGTSTSWARS